MSVALHCSFQECNPKVKQGLIESLLSPPLSSLQLQLLYFWYSVGVAEVKKKSLS